MSLLDVLITCSLVASGAFSGPTVAVELVPAVATADAEPVPGAVLTAMPVRDGDPRPPIRVHTPDPGSALLHLYPDSAHRLSVGGTAWAPPVALPATDPPERLRLETSGTGVLRLDLANDTGRPLDAWPVTVGARFQLLTTPLDVPPGRSFETECPVLRGQRNEGRKRELICELPEGTLDVRLQAEGFIPHYLWGLRLAPGEAVETAPYELERGASLIGTAVRADGAPAAGAEVVLAPAVADSVARATLAPRASSLESRTTTNERGFFQLRGISRGTFELQVRLEGYGLGSTPQLRIAEPVEHEIGEPVAVAHFPAAVVAVSPPAAPGDEPWGVLLFSPGGASRRAETDPLGEARFELLPAGRYVLILQDPRGQRWTSEQVELGPGEARVEVAVERVPVLGEVTLGGEPLAASLYFGGESGAESVRLSSGEDGVFAGVLPREGAWDLEVQAEVPKVRLVERGVEVEIDPDLGAAELDLELPDTRIEGRVLDAEGEPAEGAQVILQPDVRRAGVTQVATAADGGFTLAGQPPGRYRLKALGRGGTSSTVEVVEVSEDRAPPTVELTLEASQQIEGRVVGPDGRGVPGAVVWPVREVDSPAPLDRLVRENRTGTGGDFRLSLGRDDPRTGVAVLAPGLPLAVTPLPAGDAAPLEITLDPASAGGRLMLRGLTPEPGAAATVTLDGRWYLPLFLLTRRALRDGPPSADRPLAIPDLPPGRYRVCVRREDTQPCAAGFLPAGGTLELQFQEDNR